MIRSALLGVVVLAAAACGANANAEVESTPSASGSPVAGDDLVLRAEYTGGFVPATTTYSRLPIVSVYADGRVITEGPHILLYPGPALPNVQVKTISEQEVAKLVAAARTAGVGRPTDYGTPPVADVPSTRFTLVEDGRRLTTEVYALDMGNAAEDGLTKAQQEGRTTMRALLNTLSSLSGDAQYAPDAVAAIVQPYTGAGEGTPPPARPWRGPELPGRVLGPADVTCVTATGEQVARVLQDAGQANALTPWTSGGKQWSVVLRPLLPDETDCGSLGR